jgi:hypothetical protein
MMEKIGRNDPCPCGSGKKYKKCCLMKGEELEARHREEGRAVSSALDWLSKHYPKEVAGAVNDEFYGSLTEEEFQRLMDLPPDLQRMVYVNSSEWSIADAHIKVNGVRTRVRDLLLGPGGPLLAQASRNWLQCLGEFPLSLYEVREVKPGDGLELADLLRPDVPSVWVVERSASRTLLRYHILGTRLVRRDHDLVMSGAAYPFVRDRGLACEDAIQKRMKKNTWGSDLARDVVASLIISHWLKGLVAERKPPKLVDASTGEPIMLVTDHYRVTDWQALGTTLASQPDVEGDGKEGWVRFTPLEGEARRSRASLNRKNGDTLEVFCRTLKLADDARRWLEKIAGPILTFKIREMVDPRSPKALESAPAAPRPDVPAEIAAQMTEEYMRNFYADWADKPIPALANKTPRVAVKTEKGRRTVIDLLKSYEHHEARRVRDQGGKPFDFGFLWESLALKRE